MSEFGSLPKQGLGCMGFSAFYSSAGNSSVEKGRAVLKRAVETGVTLLNTATFYGPLNIEGYGDNLRFIKNSLEGIDRSRYQLMVKVGLDTRAPVEKTGQQFIIRGDADFLNIEIDYALEQLGTDYIDIIVLCRVPTDISIEKAVLNMKAIADTGKARAIGLSEASAETIRRAATVTNIYCIEQEWSLWTRDIEEEVVPTCRELGIKIVAYSPLGRGFLTGSLHSRSELTEATDYRLLHQPRFNDEHFATNLSLVKEMERVARRKNCSVGQLALAWLHAQGADVSPIPGTTSLQHLEENMAARTIHLSSEDLKEIHELSLSEKVCGERDAHMLMTYHGNTTIKDEIPMLNTE